MYLGLLFLVHLSRRLKCTIVIMRCLSSIFRPSSFRRSQLFTVSTSPLKPLKGIQRNFTGSNISTSSTKCIFWADRKKKMAALISDWLKHFQLLLRNRWIQWNLTGSCSSKISTSSTMFVFFRSIGKTRWPPWPLIGSDIFDFSYETAERNSTKLDRKQDLNILYQVCVFPANWKNKIAALASDWLRHFRLLLWNGWTIQWNLIRGKISTSSTQFVFFGLIRKTRLPPWPLIGWDLFDISYKTPERNSTKLDRKQDLNVLYQGYVFLGHRKNKMAALASYKVRHFLLLLWNRRTEFHETWQKTRSQHLLPNLCFFLADRKNKMAALASDWLKHFRLLLWNHWTIQWNLTGSMISRSSPKIVFFGPIGKTRMPPWPLIGWDIFDLSYDTAKHNSTKFDKKQDLNVLYQVYVFWGNQKNKMAALASDWLRHFRLLL